MCIRDRQLAAQDESRAQAEQALRQAQQLRDTRQNELHALALDRTAAETSLAGMDGRRDTIAADIEAAAKRLEMCIRDRHAH